MLTKRPVQKAPMSVDTNVWGSAPISTSLYPLTSRPYPLINITSAIPTIDPSATASTSRHTGCVFSHGEMAFTA